MRGILCAGICVLLTACSDPVPEAKRRLIILGFDGMDPVLTEQWMAAGLLPNFSRLRDQGHYQRLATTTPPQSPVAWATFATGKTQGEHGIFDFLHPDPETYLPAYSVSEVTPLKTWSAFGFELPVSGGELRNRRQGTPFWTELEQAGHRATVQRVPVTFPPDDVHRMLSGMGVPDLLGSQGTYTLYTNRFTLKQDNGRVVQVSPQRDGRIESVLQGPPHPFNPAKVLEVPVEIDLSRSPLEIRIDEQSTQLAVGQWSEWLRVTFPIPGPFNDVSGMVRLYLVADRPEFSLYVSPIHIDPRAPAIPLSHPPDYAAELANVIGDFHTIGMPEETWSLTNGHLSDEAFLAMEKTILAEREAMFFDALSRRDSALVVSVFVQTDRVSHVFYRGIDEQHPLYATSNETARGAIRWIYGEADRILGKTLDQLGAHDELVVMSDHGFTPFRRAVHLNRWLLENRYLYLKEGFRVSEAGFAQVDWGRTRAFAVGLNGLFVNVAGANPKGIVAPAQVPALKRELAAGLRQWRDEQEKRSVVDNVFFGNQIFPNAGARPAPDLIVGYASGYRASWETTLGGVPADLIVDNLSKWSGDHCVSPRLVPGVLFATFSPARPVRSIGDLPAVVWGWNSDAPSAVPPAPPGNAQP